MNATQYAKTNFPNGARRIITNLVDLYLFSMNLLGNLKNFSPSFLKHRFIKKILLSNSASYFIETGTYLGDTCYSLRHLKIPIVSIELDVELFSRAEKRFKKYDNILIINDDSNSGLEKFCKNNVLGGKPAFYLDAHYSGETTSGTINEAVPLISELKFIINNFDSFIVIIDDIHRFHSDETYPKWNNFFDLLKNRDNLKIEFFLNQLVIISKKI